MQSGSERELGPEREMIGNAVRQGEPCHLLLGVDERREVDMAGLAKAGVNGVRGAMEQATDLRNHMSFEDKHSFVFYSLRYLPFLK